MAERRFPPPWSIEELDACFVVHDHAGQKLAYVYFEDEPGKQADTFNGRSCVNTLSDTGVADWCNLKCMSDLDWEWVIMLECWEPRRLRSTMIGNSRIESCSPSCR